jgi:MFS family permease
MLKVIATTWPLLLGVMLLMVGNGVQGSLLGIRGTLEDFSTVELSVVMSAYFVGFLFGTSLAPAMIRRVGHVRVFAALGSLISAVLVLYPAVPDWWAWTLMRVIVGFSFSGIYVCAESWINNTSTNETRGQALSAYMIVQMLGIIAAQGLFAAGDPGGFVIFIIPSVLVSLAFMPILLADTPAPGFDDTRRMAFGDLFRASPLGCAGMLLTGGVFAAMFGMASVWGTMIGLTVPQIALFVAVIYVGGLVLQYPIGWLSDRMDRRRLIAVLSAVATVTMVLATVFAMPFWMHLVVATLLGGITNPLYSLLIAHTNDYLRRDQMAGASAGLLFLNGLGAITGPIATGWLMETMGPGGFFLFMGANFAGLAGYAAWRMTRRAGPVETGAFAGLSPNASALAVGAVIERKGDGNTG